MYELRHRIQARYNEVMALARRLYPNTYLPVPHIRFDLKGIVRGRAIGGHTVRVNLDLAAQNIESYLNDNIPHEAAHLVCQNNRRLGRNHNAGWKRVCLALGGNATRCYDADELGLTVKRARRTRQYLYIASCGKEDWVGSATHKKIQRGAIYLLKSTKGTLSAAGYQGKMRIKS